MDQHLFLMACYYLERCLDNHMTPDELKTARQSAGLTQADLAKLLKCSRRTVEAWEQGARNMPPAMVELFRLKAQNVTHAENAQGESGASD